MICLSQYFPAINSHCLRNWKSECDYSTDHAFVCPLTKVSQLHTRHRSLPSALLAYHVKTHKLLSGVDTLNNLPQSTQHVQKSYVEVACFLLSKYQLIFCGVLTTKSYDKHFQSIHCHFTLAVSLCFYHRSTCFFILLLKIYVHVLLLKKSQRQYFSSFKHSLVFHTFATVHFFTPTLLKIHIYLLHHRNCQFFKYWMLFNTCCITPASPHPTGLTQKACI